MSPFPATSPPTLFPPDATNGLTVGNPAGAPFLHKIAFHRQPQTRHQRQDSNDKERMMKIKALMIAAALLAAADVHAAPQKAKTAPAKAVKAAATAQKKPHPHNSRAVSAFQTALPPLPTTKSSPTAGLPKPLPKPKPPCPKTRR